MRAPEAGSLLPGFAEGPDHGVEGPGRTRLVGQVITLRGDVRGLTEELVGLVGIPFPGPGYVYDRIDGDVTAVDAFWPQ